MQHCYSKDKYMVSWFARQKLLDVNLPPARADDLSLFGFKWKTKNSMCSGQIITHKQTFCRFSDMTVHILVRWRQAAWLK